MPHINAAYKVLACVQPYAALECALSLLGNAKHCGASVHAQFTQGHHVQCLIYSYQYTTLFDCI